MEVAADGMVPFKYFHRIGGAPTETHPSFNHDAPEEVGGDIKLFDIPLQKLGLIYFLFLY